MQALSIALSIYSLIVLSFVLHSCLFENRGYNMRARSMRILIILCMIGTMFDLIGYAMAPFLLDFPLRWVINAAAILVGLWFSVAFCFYVIGCIKMHSEMSIVWASVSFISGMIFTMIILAALPFRLVFYYDEGIFVPGPLYDVSLLASVILALYALVIIFFHAKVIGLHDVVVLCLYIVFPVIAVGIETCLPELSLTYPGMAVATLFLYLMIQAKEVQESRVEEVEAKTSAQKQSEFLALMSHEIRTHVNAMTGLNEMVLRETNERKIYDYALNIHNSGKNLLSVVDDILDSASIRANRLTIVPAPYETYQLGEAFYRFGKIVGQKEGVEFILQADENMPIGLVGDLTRLEQIINNLVSNAVKYTDDGYVKFILGYEKIDNESVYLKIEVEDTGIGIKEANIPRILDIEDYLIDKKSKFAEGTGLGIMITKSLLELMDSSLEITSTYGEGSVFSFRVKQQVSDWIPIGKMGVRQMMANSNDDRPLMMAPSAQILLVDDYKLNNLVCEGLLKPFRVNCDSVESGEKALKMCAVKHYDLIFMDQMMPIMDGVECLHRIRRESLLNRDTPIIAVTANVVSGNRSNLIEEGFTEYIAKPVDPKRLEQILMNFLPQEFIVWGRREKEIAELSSIRTTAGYTGSAEPAEQIRRVDSFVAREEREKDMIAPAAKSEMDKLRGISMLLVNQAAGQIGDEKLYVELVKEFYDNREKTASDIRSAYDAKDIKNYTIYVHGLKSSARIIGAYELSDEAKKLEEAGHAEDQDTIRAYTDTLSAHFDELCLKLGEVFASGDGGQKDVIAFSENEWRVLLLRLKECADDFDLQGMENVLSELLNYEVDDAREALVKSLRTYVQNMDYEEVSQAATEYLSES